MFLYRVYSVIDIMISIFFPSLVSLLLNIHICLCSGLRKTGIRGIQDTRQIVDGKTIDIENNDKKRGSKVQTLNIRQLMKKAI